MQCSNDLRAKPDPEPPQSQIRKRKWEDLQPQIQLIERVYNVQVGSRLTEGEFEAKAFKKQSFHEGDLAIVQRSDRTYQYVMILDRMEGKYVYHDTKRSASKLISFFHAVKEEELPPTVPISFDEEDQISASVPETLNCQDGPRTLEADPFFQELTCTQPAGNKLVIDGKNFYPISSKIQGFATKRLASCGSTTDREILLLDPHNAPLLERHYQALMLEILDIQKRIGPLYPEQVLRLVMHHLRSRIFFVKADQQLRKVEKIFREALADAAVVKVRNNKFLGELIPAISLERYIAEGAGVCRHMSLAACYLLDRLTKEPLAKPILDGSVQHIRDNIPLGAHSWAVFIPRIKPQETPQRWILDGQFDVLVNFALPEGRARLSPYGDALNRMLGRTNPAAQLNGQT